MSGRTVHGPFLVPRSLFLILELAKRKLLSAISFICLDKTEVHFLFFVYLVTENDKTEVDFCFSFICFSLRKKQKTIKRKLVFVFRLFCLICAKNKKR